MKTISSFTLNISLIIYLLYFIPQILHNFYQNNNQNFNYITHIMMVFSSSIDLILSFACQLPWQYQFVSIVNILFILIQDTQIYINKLLKTQIFHLFVFLIILISFFIIIKKYYYLNLIINLGYCNIFLYSFYWIPQIIYNFRYKYNNTFSIIFLQLNLLAVICDIISGISLSWPYSIIITSVTIFFLILIIMIQYIHYKKKFK